MAGAASLRRHRKGALLTAALAFVAAFLSPSSAQVVALPSSVVPVPPAERGLVTVVANGRMPVPGATKDLEGACFDASGNLLFSDVQGGRVMKRDPRGRISALVTLTGLQPGGLAIHDGRIFIAAGNGRGGGAVVSIKPDGSDLRTVVPVSAGFMPNDVVFARDGSFYFTDARGTADNPIGGVYLVAAGGGTPEPVLTHVAVANGIALSPDGKTLWVGEFGANRLHRIGLATPTTATPFASTIAYYFIGPAPDSMRVDAQGHVYVAMYGQGRIMVFAPSGLPVGQILLPDRDTGNDLHSTSMAIRPGTHDLAIVTSDGEGGRGASIFGARAFGGALVDGDRR